MTVTKAPGTRREPTRRPGWAAVPALLGIEYLALSFVFDVRPLLERSDGLAWLGRAGALGPLALAIATATLLLSGRRSRAALRCALSERAGRRLGTPSAAGLVGLHASALAAFALLTRALTQGGPPGLPPALLAAAWLAAGTGWVLSALALALAPARLAGLLRGGAWALALGGVVGAAAFGAGSLAGRLWDPLGPSTTAAATALLRLAGFEVASGAGRLAADGFEVRISPACSGYEGMGLLLVLSAAYLLVFRRELRFPAALVLLPLGVALAWAANVVRLAALLAIGAAGAPEIALGGFHSKAGWVLFCALALGLAALARVFARARTVPGAPERPSDRSASLYLLPLLVWVAAGLFGGLFSSGSEILHPAGVAATAAVLLAKRRELPDPVRPGAPATALALGAAAALLWVAAGSAADPRAFADGWPALAAQPAGVPAAWLPPRLAGALLIAPAAEELAFRGYLLRRLQACDFAAVPYARFDTRAVVLSSLASGVLHSHWLAGGLAGALFALAQWRGGRLADAVLAHAVANAALAGLALAGGHTGPWP
jgi:exosortase E/protease (VPEID-CTERM system)